MNCPNCGQQLPEEQKFCDGCGTQLEDTGSHETEKDAPLQQRKSKKALIIGGIIVVILGLCVVSAALIGGYFYFRNEGGISLGTPSSITDDNFLGNWQDGNPSSCAENIIVQGNKITFRKGEVSFNILGYDGKKKIYILKLAGNFDALHGGDYFHGYQFMRLGPVSPPEPPYQNKPNMQACWFNTSKEALDSLKWVTWHADACWDKTTSN
jgi:hypothetical protein